MEKRRVKDNEGTAFTRFSGKEIDFQGILKAVTVVKLKWRDTS